MSANQTELKYINAFTAKFCAVEADLQSYIIQNNITEIPNLFSGKVYTRETPLKQLQACAYKTHEELRRLEDEIECESMADMVNADYAVRCAHTQSLRDRGVETFLRCSELARQIKGDKAAKALRTAIADIFKELPQSCQSIEDWREGVEANLRYEYTPGRPAFPVEVTILRLRRDLAALVELAALQTEGDINTPEALLLDVSAPKQGRPKLGAGGVMERRLKGLRKRLDELSPNDPNRALKKARLDAKILRLQSKLGELDSGLTGIDRLHRRLESVRAAHLDLVAFQVETEGRASVLTMLEVLKNEVDQQEIVASIMDIDPNSRISLAHKVNPRSSLERIARVCSSPLLKPDEIKLAKDLSELVNNYKEYRQRHAA